MIFIDAPERSENDVVPFLEILRDEVNRAYRTQQQGQKTVWITTQPASFLWD
jgi:hypothetical protein